MKRDLHFSAALDGQFPSALGRPGLLAARESRGFDSRVHVVSSALSPIRGQRQALVDREWSHSAHGFAAVGGGLCGGFFSSVLFLQKGLEAPVQLGGWLALGFSSGTFNEMIGNGAGSDIMMAFRTDDSGTCPAGCIGSYSASVYPADTSSPPKDPVGQQANTLVNMQVCCFFFCVGCLSHPLFSLWAT